MKRRSFLKKGALLSLSTAFVPSFLPGGPGLNATPAVLRPAVEEWKENQINIAWIGHATVLINFYGKVIITDPVLLNSIGIYMFGFTYGPRRINPPALDIDEIPKPDLVLLSHAHMDHMDYLTLAEISDKYPGEVDCITAYNTADVIGDLDWKSLHEMDWGDTYSLPGMHFKALEVKHFGWRFPWERDRSKGFFKDGRSFNAYVIERNGKRILFGGDTAFTDKFKKSGEKVDIAIMPIGAYNPWVHAHCNPEEALQMAKEMDAKVIIPIHFNTFLQGWEPRDEPMKRLLAAKDQFAMNVGVTEIGGTFTTA